MPCRDTAIAGVAQAIARKTSNIDDVQMLSMYAELKRDPEARSAVPPTISEWRAHLRGLHGTIDADQTLTQNRRERMLGVINDAGNTPADGPTFYAMKRVQARAATARLALFNLLGQISNEYGREREHIEAAYKSLVAENRSIRRTDSPPQPPEYLGYDPSGLPADRATRWAMAMLTYGGPLAANTGSHRTMTERRIAIANARCGNCGEFVGRGGGHMCAETANRPEVSSTDDGSVRFRRMTASAVAETTAAATLLEQEAQTAQSVGHVDDGLDDGPLREWERELLEGRPAAEGAEESSAVRRIPRRPAPQVAEAFTVVDAETLSTSAPVAVDEPAVSAPLSTATRTSDRRYRLDSGYTLRTQNRSGLMRNLRENGGQAVTYPVTVRTPDGFNVSGNLQVTDRVLPGRRWSRTRIGDRYHVTGPETQRDIRCTCADYRRNYDCVHVRESREQVAAWLNEREPRAAVAPEETVNQVTDSLAEGFAQADAATESARARFQAADDGVSYEDDMETFQADWEETRARFRSGDRSITFMTENVTGGLSTPENGRSFGLEIEIDFPNDEQVHDGQRSGTGNDGNTYMLHQYRAKNALARALYDEGLSEWDYPLPWHGLRTRGGYSDAPNRWSVQFDRSVDGLDGVRGAELVSPILYDTPETWQNLNRICELVKEHGGQVTMRTGLHVNVGGGDFNHTIENHNSLLGMADTFEDQLIRCANNPENGGEWHRGRAFCNPVTVPAQGFRSLSSARHANGHLSMVNLAAMPDERERVNSATRAEFRQFDGTLDVGRIQANTKMSLAMMDAAKRGVDFSDIPREAAGTHRARNHTGRGMPRLAGEAWANDTKGFRRLADMLFSRKEDKKQMLELFASSKWQKTT